MTTETPGACPQCGEPIPTPRPPLCPRCHYPLLFIEQKPRLEDEAKDLLRPTPEASADHTMVGMAPVVSTQPEVAAAAAPAVQLTTCPRCGFANDPSRVWCESCGNDLTGTVEPPAPPPPPPPPPPEPPRRSVWSWLWFPVALVLAVSLGLGITYLVLKDRGRAPSPTTSASPASPAPTATPTALANKDVTATASSTLPSNGKVYVPSRTIDGKPVTAWNSDGKKVGADAKGVTLRWTFASPVRVAWVYVFNGYQKDQRRFDANGRLRSVRVVTEAGVKVVELADKMGSQRVTIDSGPTTYVEFRVESVYRNKATFKDLALSEVQFFATAP